MTGLGHRLAGFWRDATGSAPLEFALAVPILMVLFCGAMENGLMMARQVGLDRALDLTMRDLRLGRFEQVSQGQLRAEICARAIGISDCAHSLAVELFRVDTATFALPDAQATCLDRAAQAEPALTLQPGVQNDLMIVRICASVDALFPTAMLGTRFVADPQHGYQLTATSAFVVEP